MDAEDIVLDVFIFIWNNVGRINIDKSIRSYLFTSVRNRALNHLRGIRSEVLSEDHDIAVLDPALADIDIEGISAVISAALETVSDRARLIWKMKREQNKTNAQVSQELNLSEKTVEAEVTRIRKLLHITIKRNFIFSLFL